MGTSEYIVIISVARSIIIYSAQPKVNILIKGRNAFDKSND